MSSLTIKQHKENGYYVHMEYEDDLYKVAVYPCYDTNRCGYAIRKMYYSMNKEKQALATFRRYVKKYCKNT